MSESSGLISLDPELAKTAPVIQLRPESLAAPQGEHRPRWRGRRQHHHAFAAVAQPDGDRRRGRPLGEGGDEARDDLIEVRAIAGLTYPLVDSSYTPDAAAGEVTDGLTPSSTRAYLKDFPYLAVPYDGYDTPSK